MKYQKLLWFLLLFFLLTMAGCASSPEEQPLPADVTVTQGLYSISNLPLYIALEKDFFLREGLQVTLETTGSPVNVLQGLLDGKAQFALAGPEQSLYLLQQGSKTPIQNIAQVTATNGYFLLSRKNTSPFSWQSLKGKVIIGCVPGTLPETIFEHLLRKNELRPYQQVHIITNLPPQSVLGVFQAGTGAYLLAEEPLASRLEKESGCLLASSLTLSGQSPTATTVMVTRDYLTSEREICQRFVNALSLSLLWLNEATPEEIVDAGHKYFPQEEAKTLLRAVSRYKTLGLWPSSPLVNEEGFNRLQQVLFEEEELNAIIPLEQIIDNGIASTSRAMLK